MSYAPDIVIDPTWDHPVIAYERGCSDATRHLPRRFNVGKYPVQYGAGYVEGEQWKKDRDPMRHLPKR